jgi:nucleotide-binding universal stress UspA family protein
MPGLLPKKTIVPIDFSDLSYSALDRALEIAGPNTVINVIHVLAPMMPTELGILDSTISDEARIESVIEHLRDRLSDDKYAGLQIHAVVGDPGHEIADFAQKEAADLIVIPSHGYGFIRHLLLGSTAERVVRLAHCPVLVLRS